jgi:DNA-binding NarL/FixJ family response regulator
MKKIVLADSNELIRLGFRAVLNTEDTLEVAGEARNSKELLDVLGSFEADCCIIDYTSEGFDLNCIPDTLSKFPEIKFLAVSPNPTAPTVVDAIRGGVLSHVKKECSLNEIKEALFSTLDGNRFFCGNILQTIRDAEINVDDISDIDFSCDSVQISPRELDIIQYIAEGYTNTQVAEMLFLSPHTVNTHRKNIMNKLGVKNTAGIVMYAVKINLVSPNKFLFTGKTDS